MTKASHTDIIPTSKHHLVYEPVGQVGEPLRSPLMCPKALTQGF
jgi:hypothetical protein